MNIIIRESEFRISWYQSALLRHKNYCSEHLNNFWTPFADNGKPLMYTTDGFIHVLVVFGAGRCCLLISLPSAGA